MNLPALPFVDKASYPQLVYEAREKLKKLSGFQPERHFLPRYYSKSLETFVGTISVSDIEERLGPVAERLRAALALGINDYTWSVDSSGGAFDCKDFALSACFVPDRESLGEVIYTVNLQFKNTEPELWKKVTDSIPWHFHYIKLESRPGFDLTSFIEQYESRFGPVDSGETGSEEARAHYDLGATGFSLDFGQSGRKIFLTSEEIRIFLSSRFSLRDFIGEFMQ